jgi:hypothetical protein
MGDPYTVAVQVDDPLHSLGDYNRDYHVSMEDFRAFTACATTPLAPLCEILDMNRNNVIDNGDQVLFFDCYTGPPEGASGAGAEGFSEELADDLATMAAWTLAEMPVDQRAKLADEMRALAKTTGAPEAPLLLGYADVIDPQ